MRHRNGSLNFLCRGPPIFLWLMCLDAPLKHIFLWRIRLHAPHKRWGRMPSSRWWWGPHFFCGAWAPVRHRKYQFSGAPVRHAPQNFCGASPKMHHRILTVAHGRFGAPQKHLPLIASFLVVEGKLNVGKQWRATLSYTPLGVASSTRGGVVDKAECRRVACRVGGVNATLSCLDARLRPLEKWPPLHVDRPPTLRQIGRASCRERV